jgi:predicted house-cleaning noncanonical NTP pyrophosphatase (MazG superfamily)
MAAVYIKTPMREVSKSKMDKLEIRLGRSMRRAQLLHRAELEARDSDKLRSEVLRALKNKNRREQADWLLEVAHWLKISGDYLSRRDFERAKKKWPRLVRGVYLPAGARARARESEVTAGRWRAELAARDSDKLRGEVVRALKNKNRRERADWLLEVTHWLKISGNDLSTRLRAGQGGGARAWWCLLACGGHAPGQWKGRTIPRLENKKSAPPLES